MVFSPDFEKPSTVLLWSSLDLDSGKHVRDLQVSRLCPMPCIPQGMVPLNTQYFPPFKLVMFQHQRYISFSKTLEAVSLSLDVIKRLRWQIPVIFIGSIGRKLVDLQKNRFLAILVVTFLGWLCDPFRWLSDLQPGDKKVNLNTWFLQISASRLSF